MFYLKLAWANIKKNKTTYLPFLASMVFLVILNLLMQVMLHNEGMQTLPQAMTVKSIFGFGNTVIMIFSVVFSFYTNSFLIKRRQKELGLYNILGMDKKSLGLMLFLESCLSLIIALVVGLVTGSILSKLLFLILKKMTGFGEDFIFQFNTSMLIYVILLFGGLFLLLLIYNITQMLRTNPIELLHGSDTGEKEPKAHWLLSLAGIISLGVGYYISLSIQSPVEAIVLFFVAIVLVIIGTYLLAITASVTILKFLRSRESFYYKPKAFVNISGMIYRMKQNGAGLASICILSTMVLVTVSSTAGLFFGQEDVLRTRNPSDISVSTQLPNPDLEKQVLDLAAENEIIVDENYQFLTPNFPLLREKEGIFEAYDDNSPDMKGLTAVNIWTITDYEKAVGKQVELQEDELLLFEISGEYQAETMTFGDQTLKIKKELDELPFISKSVSIADSYILFVKDETVIQKTYRSLLPEAPPVNYQTELLLNISGSSENRLAFSNAVYNLGNDLNAIHANEEMPNPNQNYASVSTIDEDRSETRSFTGGFLFMGIIFGLSFTAATALIIYYKQVSEGYEDARRFEIMQQVGMSHKEVKQTILSQILMVFLFPIALAVIHLAFALPSIRKILVLFGLINNDLITWMTAISVIIFTLCYLVVYWQTSRVYYRIVERKG